MEYVIGLPQQHPFPSLSDALNSPLIRANDILWLNQEYYSGDSLTAVLKGSADRPIIVKPRPGLKPRISGTVNTISLQYVEFHDIEFYYDWNGTRNTFTKDTAPSRLTVVGNGVKFVNCVFHDITQVSCFSNATNAEFYGCLFFNIGIGGSDWNFVHNIYAQNGVGSTKIFDTCIFMDSVSQFGIHIYGESGNLKNFTIRNCIIAGDRIALFGGLTDLENFTFDNNFCTMLTRIGYGAGSANNSSVVTDNFFIGKPGASLEFFNQLSLTLTGNIFTFQRPYYLYPQDAQNTDAYTINNNQYCNNLGDLRFTRKYDSEVDSTQWFSLASWQADVGGHDAASTQQANQSDYDRAIVYPNAYNNEKAHVAIANAGLEDTFAIDLSAISGLVAGDTVTVRNGQDYYGDIQTLILDEDKMIIVSMEDRTIALPDGTGFETPADLYPSIGVFVVEKQ